jgi:hypothetical protein
MTTETYDAIFIALPAQQQFLEHRLSKNTVSKRHGQQEQDETALTSRCQTCRRWLISVTDIDLRRVRHEWQSVLYACFDLRQGLKIANSCLDGQLLSARTLQLQT